MILKGSQRGHGADLAIHLMNSFENERIEIAEVYGAVAGDLFGAFAEFEAVAAGTRAKQYLYSLSINPPAPLTREQYLDAIGTIEHRLGLTDQPRTIVFHVKDGREHCHVVWSRIDVDKMKAVHMAHDRRKLMDLACQLAEKYGLDLPPGLKAWEEKQKHEKNKLEPSLAEKAQAEQTGITPEQRREEITAAYQRSDGADTFRQALEDKGYILAKGDRRALVVVDKFGGVHSLSRYVEGHSVKQIRVKLAALSADQLPSVDQAKEMVRQRTQAQQDVGREQDLADASAEALAKAEARKAAEEVLAKKHAARRLEARQAEQELLTRQQAERLSLHAAQKSESAGLLFRVRSAVADLMKRTPGLRSVLAHIQEKTHLDPKEKQRLENEALDRRHARERRDFERRKRVLAQLETRERQSLEKALRKEQRLQEEARLKAAQARPMVAKARQDFSEAAGDQGLWRSRDFAKGELLESFNEQTGMGQRPDDSGGDDEKRAPDWKHRAARHARNQRRRGGKGYGYRKDDK